MERQKQIMLQLGSLNNGGAAQPAAGDQSGAATAATPPDAGTATSGRRYKVAMRIPITMRQLRWCRISLADDAIVAFQNFIKKYPDSTYQPNANYWLGQLNYNKGKKMMPPIISPR